MVVELEYQSNNNIGAGDIVEATLLSGVVASTATKNSIKPRPVLLELLDGVESPAKWFFSKNKSNCSEVIFKDSRMVKRSR